MKIIVILLILLSGENAMSQLKSDTNILSLFSSDQKFVKLALDSSICLLRQNYILSDSSGGEFGRNNDLYFGKKYSIGVITDKGILTAVELLRPWENDKNFGKYRGSQVLKPKLSNVLCRRLNEQKFDDLKRPVIDSYGDSATVAYEVPDSMRCITASFGTTDSSGWLVFITYAGAELNDSSQLHITAYKPKTSLSSLTSKVYIKAGLPKETIIGGIYFTCKIAIGKIIFTAAGIAKGDDKGWFIQAFDRELVKQKTTDILNLLNK